MYLKISLLLSAILLLAGCSSKDESLQKEKEISFIIESTNKNLKPIMHELNISNIGNGECMDFNKSDLGVLSKREGLVIDTRDNKDDFQDTFVKIKQGDSLEVKACNIDNKSYKFDIKQHITNPIINGSLKFNGKEYDRLSDIQINNEATIDINESINYIDLFKMSVKRK